MLSERYVDNPYNIFFRLGDMSFRNARPELR